MRSWKQSNDVLIPNTNTPGSKHNHVVIILSSNELVLARCPHWFQFPSACIPNAKHWYTLHLCGQNEVLHPSWFNRPTFGSGGRKNRVDCTETVTESFWIHPVILQGLENVDSNLSSSVKLTLTFASVPTPQTFCWLSLQLTQTYYCDYWQTLFLLCHPNIGSVNVNAFTWFNHRVNKSSDQQVAASVRQVYTRKALF